MVSLRRRTAQTIQRKSAMLAFVIARLAMLLTEGLSQHTLGPGRTQ